LSTVIYRTPTPDDLVSVAARMRISDAMEVAAAAGHTPMQALATAVQTSTVSFTAVIDGNPEGIFGIACRGGLAAEIWMLGTDDLVKDPALFLAETRRVIDEWSTQFAILHNFVDDENVVAKEWLRRTGFTIAEPRPYGVGQLPFCYFYRVGSPRV
jgi:hypothetical protein